MKTTAPMAPEKNENSHINPATLHPALAPEQAAATSKRGEQLNEPASPIHESNPEPSHPALCLLPPAVRDRKFRACSFAARLTEIQRSVLWAWFANEKLSIDD